MVSSFDLSWTKVIARRDQKIVIQGQFLHWRMRLVKKKVFCGWKSSWKERTVSTFE